MIEVETIKVTMVMTLEQLEVLQDFMKYEADRELQASIDDEVEHLKSLGWKPESTEKAPAEKKTSAPKKAQKRGRKASWNTERAEELLEENWPLEDIAEQVGVPVSKVRTYARLHGYEVSE